MTLKAFALSVAILSTIPRIGLAISCVGLLDVPYELQVKARLISSLEQRKALEENVHRSMGSLSTDLETQLNLIFRLRDRQNSIPSRNQRQILRAIQRDPIARRLSQPSQSKLIRLVFHGHARPYMALLIARYMEERENRQGYLSPNVMFAIEMIVLMYTIEWTARTLIRHRLYNPDTSLNLNDKEKQEILDAFRNPGRHRPTQGLNYNQPNGRVGYESLFIGFLSERQAWLASTNLFSIGESIFE